MSPREAVLQWYIWASRELGWTTKETDETELGLFFELVALNDKLNHPDDYTPAEWLFGHF